MCSWVNRPTICAAAAGLLQGVFRWAGGHVVPHPLANRTSLPFVCRYRCVCLFFFCLGVVWPPDHRLSSSRSSTAAAPKAETEDENRSEERSWSCHLALLLRKHVARVFQLPWGKIVLLSCYSVRVFRGLGIGAFCHPFPVYRGIVFPCRPSVRCLQPRLPNLDATRLMPRLPLSWGLRASSWRHEN